MRKRSIDDAAKDTGEFEAGFFVASIDWVPNADGIACWFIDTDYNEESFVVHDAYLLGADDPFGALKTTLKVEIDLEARATLNSYTARAFDRPKKGWITVKVINHLGDEVIKVFRVH